MPRARQLSLQLKNRPTHGGRREGAGRPRRSTLQNHVTRPNFASREPLHVTLRVRRGIPNLRRKELQRSLRAAVRRAREKGLVVVHFALLSNHLHLIVESSDKRGLARQMQSFAISFAKRLNALERRAGAVFGDRYHARALKTPREVKNAIRYVLTNERKHAGHGYLKVNDCSSAALVPAEAWKALLGRTWRDQVESHEEDPVTQETLGDQAREWVQEPRTWLLRTGWMRA